MVFRLTHIGFRLCIIFVIQLIDKFLYQILFQIQFVQAVQLHYELNYGLLILLDFASYIKLILFDWLSYSEIKSYTRTRMCDLYIHTLVEIIYLQYIKYRRCYNKELAFRLRNLQ